MALSCSGKFFRILLLVCNSVIFVAGAIMAGFGIYLVVEANMFKMTGPAWAMVVAFLVIGCLVFVTGFLGCFGAWKKSKCILQMFAAIIILIIIAEVVCGIILIVNKDKFKPFIEEYFASAIKEIEGNGDSSLLITIQHFQDAFDCCGANGPNDWADPMKYCCDAGEATCFPPLKPGCVNKIYYELQENSVGIGVGVVTLAVIEIGAIVAALILAKQSQ